MTLNISILWLQKQNTSQVKGTQIFNVIESVLTLSSSVTQNLIHSVSKGKPFEIKNHWHSKTNRDQITKMLIIGKLMSWGSVHKIAHSDIGKLLSFGKDVIYSMLNDSKIDWRKLLICSAKQSLIGIDNTPDKSNAKLIPCFIIDDTDIPKKGQCIEQIGRIFSHVSSSCKLGFKSLNLCLWTGKNVVHLDFSLHIEMGKNKNQGLSKRKVNQRYSKNRKPGTPGYKRFAERIEKKTKMAMTMIVGAIRNGVKAQYILADSWFFNADLIVFSKAKGVPLISRPKLNNWKYDLHQKSYTLKELIRKIGRSVKRRNSRNLNLQRATIKVVFQGSRVNLHFYRPRNSSETWNVIVTNDLNISAIQAFQIYQNRWSIEVSYKELKQHLKFGKCQSRDFDAQLADATISLMAYNYLSHYKAIHEYQSIGALFDHVSHNWQSPTVMDSFWNQLYVFIQSIADTFSLAVDRLIEKFFESNKDCNFNTILFTRFTAET